MAASHFIQIKGAFGTFYCFAIIPAARAFFSLRLFNLQGYIRAYLAYLSGGRLSCLSTLTDETLKTSVRSSFKLVKKL
jgi:hypothetical protein